MSVKSWEVSWGHLILRVAKSAAMALWFHIALANAVGSDTRLAR